MSIKLKLEGFDELMNKIQKAEGNVESATKRALQEGANVMDAEIKAQLSATGDGGNLGSSIPSPTIENDFGLFTARVGWRKGSYNPRNLSDGYKALFLNYGTPRRKKHGIERARGFIQRAKTSARPKIKKVQEQALKDILKGL